ncbi:hypothetical protein D3C72_2224550 [compost metagenome]
MGVDKAGGDQGILILGKLDTLERRQQIGGVADPGDPAVLDQQHAVLEIFIGLLDADHGGVGEAVQDGGAVGFEGASHLVHLDHA